MNADSIFLKGSSHLVCEDYANHRPEGLAFVADGCSSAPGSDVAARLAYLAMDKGLATLRLVPGETLAQKGMEADLAWLGETAAADVLAADVAEVLACCLATELYATGLTARLVGGRLLVTVVGDGGVLLRRRDGQMVWYRLSWPANAPLYWQYLIDAAAAARWRESFPDNDLLIEVFDLDRQVALDPALAQSCLRRDPDGMAWFFLATDASDIEWVMLCSDGIASFADAAGTVLVDLDILAELCRFPNQTGAFLKRRVLRMVSALNAQGIMHRDDFAAAVLVV